jgi:ABC-type glycerol-3-phosphate transport system substrate-binding protein
VRAGKFFQDRREFSQQVGGTMPKISAADFLNGLTATIMASTGGLAGFEKNAKFKVGTAMLPKADGFGCCTGWCWHGDVGWAALPKSKLLP